ncbi:MAG: histidine phosphatase family protein [Bacillota bacterium]
MGLIHIVRHGETSYNRQGRFQGQLDVPLSAEGLRQAEKLAQRLAPDRIDTVFSSDLMRARVTAIRIAEATGAKIITDPRLRELDVSRWSGLTLHEVQEQFPQDLVEWKRKPLDISPHGGETIVGMAERIRAFIAEHSWEGNATYVIVTHGHAIKVLLCLILGMDLSLKDRFWADNASLTTVWVNDGTARLMLLNDTCHLA